jgi:hypothetical protein
MHRKGVAYRNESNAHNEISWEKKDGKKLGKVYTLQYSFYCTLQHIQATMNTKVEFMNVQLSLRCLGIILRVLRFKVSVNNVWITD